MDMVGSTAYLGGAASSDLKQDKTLRICSFAPEHKLGVQSQSYHSLSLAIRRCPAGGCIIANLYLFSFFFLNFRKGRLPYTPLVVGWLVSPLIFPPPVFLMINAIDAKKLNIAK